MTWTEYILYAAKDSKGSAQHWFRYLRKHIDKCGFLFTESDVKELCQNKALTSFQRVSLKFAFEEGSPTREYIIRLNQRVDSKKRLAELRAKHECE
jgi:hypothetical protein